MDAENSLAALKTAIAHQGNPEIINSDQGSQFTCELWTQNVEKEAKITICMDGRGWATDNIFIERLLRTVKQIYVYICPSSDGTELYKALNKFFDYYNNVKTHQGIEKSIPAHYICPQLSFNASHKNLVIF